MLGIDFYVTVDLDWLDNKGRRHGLNCFIDQCLPEKLALPHVKLFVLLRT